MRPPWLAAGSDSEEESSSDEEVETTSAGAVKETKIKADLTLADALLQKCVIGHQEDEKAILRLQSLSLERQEQQARFDGERLAILSTFHTADAAIAAREQKAAEAGNAAQLEGLKAERKEAFQAYYAQESRLAQDETGTTLQVVKEVEKVADKTSLREGDKETVASLMAWAKELKDEKKVESDSSQARVNTILRIAELREKAALDYLTNKNKAAWDEAEKQVQQLIKEQKDKNDEIRNNLKKEVEKRIKDEGERQKQRQEAIRQLQKEQAKRSKGKKK